MTSLKILLEHTNSKAPSTIAAEFVPNKRKESAYQSEVELEKEFIATLKTQGYEYVKINDEEALEANLCQKLQELDNTTLSDTEWQRFFKQVLAKSNASIIEKTILIQKDFVQPLK